MPQLVLDADLPARSDGTSPLRDQPEGGIDARTRLETTRSILEERFPDHPKRYLYVLTGVGAIDAADRTILATVFEDIKRAFDVSDSQLGLLTAAYFVVAALSVIPFGWLADRWHRVRLIAIGFVPWSIAMIWTGAATSFAMMFVARLFLGTIEATNGPSSPSLLGDYYRVRERSRVMGTFSVGVLIGSMLGLAAGGVLAGMFGWRWAFFIWGGVGFLCGGVVLRALPEPKRGLPDAIHRVEEELRALDAPADENVTDQTPVEPTTRTRHVADYRRLSVKEAVLEVGRVRTMWFVFIGGAVGDFFMSGLGVWAPTFFRRYHNLSAAAAGGLVALLALSTVAGILVGSRISDRLLEAGRASMRVKLAAASNVLSFGSLAVAFGLDNFALVIPFFLISGFLIGIPTAPLQAVGLDTLVPHLRGRAMAVRSLLRAGAMAASPLIFGILSDLYGLRSALLFAMPAVLVAGFVTLLAAGTYTSDMAFAQAEAVHQHQLEDEDGSGIADDLLEEIVSVAGIDEPRGTVESAPSDSDGSQTGQA